MKPTHPRCGLAAAGLPKGRHPLTGEAGSAVSAWLQRC
jgi:hypothetical protein